MEIVWFSLAGFGGALLSGIAGWWKSGAKFDAAKFFPTFFRALVAGGGIALAYPFIEMGLWTGLVAAFLTGAGVDVAVHRGVGAIQAKKG